MAKGQKHYRLSIEALDEENPLDPDDVRAFENWADGMLASADFCLRVGSLEEIPEGSDDLLELLADEYTRYGEPLPGTPDDDDAPGPPEES